MRNAVAPPVEALVHYEIQRLVFHASLGTRILRAGEHAFRLLEAYPDSGRTGGELVNEIAAAAAKAGVAVEIRQPALFAA